MGFNQGLIIGIVIFVVMIVAFVPVIRENVANADNQYQCLDVRYSIQSANDLLCTNATYGCCGAVLKTLNNSFTPPLCTNASGVGLYNESACSGFSLYNQSSTDVGLTATETTLFNVAMLFVVIGGVFVFIKSVMGKTTEK